MSAWSTSLFQNYEWWNTIKISYNNEVQLFVICYISIYKNKIFGFTLNYNFIIFFIEYTLKLFENFFLSNEVWKLLLQRKTQKKKKYILHNVRTSGVMEFRSKGRLSDIHRKVVHSNTSWMPILFCFPTFWTLNNFLPEIFQI